MLCDTWFMDPFPHRYWQWWSCEPMTSFNFILTDAKPMSWQIRTKFQINIIAWEAHVSDSEFLKDVKYVLNCLLRFWDSQRLRKSKYDLIQFCYNVIKRQKYLLKLGACMLHTQFSNIYSGFYISRSFWFDIFCFIYFIFYIFLFHTCCNSFILGIKKSIFCNRNRK